MRGFIFVVLICLSTILCKSNASIQCKNPNKVAYTIYVSKSGRGNFTTVQDAVNAVPSRNDRWVRIYVDSGTYWEQVTVWYDKYCILLEGHSRDDTTIAYNAHQSTDTSPTFQSLADNFVAKNIAFKNSYSLENTINVRNREDRLVTQAVAIVVIGDKSAFYNCAFMGYQDTLWDATGRHYFKNVYIEGAIDFIWGNGQSIYEDCLIRVTGDGYITAQGRSSSKEPTGFVFIRGSVYGNGNTYLGRAYDEYSRVIFYKTKLSNIINPLGWDAWKYTGHKRVTYAEVDCTGKGSNMSKRVKWEKKMSTSKILKYTTRLFIDREQWINRQP